MKKASFFILSLFITGILLYFLLSQSRWSDWSRLFLALDRRFLLLYLVLYIVALFARTLRYRILLKSARTLIQPSFGDLILVTSVRNMLVDLLPARTGELSYPVLLNRIYRVNLYPSLTSLAYAFLFDFLALGPLLGIAGMLDSLTFNQGYSLLWLFSLGIIAVGLFLIFGAGLIFRQLGQGLNRRFYPFLKGKKHLGRLPELCEGISQSFNDLRKAGIFWKILGLSLVIRALKYSSLYLLLQAFVQALTGSTASLPFLVTCLGLIGSEAAASLPIGGLAGFGFYEGVLGAVLTTLGLSPAQAVLVSFGMHFLTQVVDYSWGGVSFLLILLRMGRFKYRASRVD
jgi:hypothetical protein